MRLTTEVLTPYVGGQVEIQNEIERYIFRGEIAQVTVDGEELQVRFTWFAKGEGYPPIRWVKADHLDYGLSLTVGFTSISEIGRGSKSGSNRICIESVISNETIVFFPPDGSRLDPAKVEGLVLEVAKKDDKKPFHEVLSSKLEAAAKGTVRGIRDDDLVRMSTILEILYQGKMPADAAHKIAEDHKHILVLLSDPEHEDVARLAAETLADLRNRQN